MPTFSRTAASQPAIRSSLIIESNSRWLHTSQTISVHSEKETRAFFESSRYQKNKNQCALRVSETAWCIIAQAHFKNLLFAGKFRLVQLGGRCNLHLISQPFLCKGDHCSKKQ